MLDDSDRPPSERSIGFASERDCKRALQTVSHTAVWQLFGHTFIRSDTAMVIARVDSIGADVSGVTWAWKYDNVFGMMQDWNEILHVPMTEPTIRTKYKGEFGL